MGRHLIITIHGIRTFGAWQERLERLVKKSSPSTQFYHYKYGYLSVIAFIIPPLRWIITRRFCNDIVRMLSREKWDRIDVVAHSFGTHLIAKALSTKFKEDLPGLHTLILAGSVLRHTFDWMPLIPERAQRVVNDCGTDDSVLFLNQLVVLFTGMAGRIGFIGMTGDRFQNRFFPFGHGGFFMSDGVVSDDFMTNYWVNLLTSDRPIEKHDNRPPLNLLRGVLYSIAQNIEPIKLAVYLTPLVLLSAYFYILKEDATTQRYLAESRLETVSELASRVTFYFNEELQRVPGTDIIRGELMKAMAEILDSLEVQPTNAASINLIIESTARRIQVGDLASSHGNIEQARKEYLGAWQSLEAFPDEYVEVPELGFNALVILWKLAQLDLFEGDFSDVRMKIGVGREIAKLICKVDENLDICKWGTAVFNGLAAQLLKEQGKFDSAIVLNNLVLSETDGLLGTDLNDYNIIHGRFVAMRELSSCFLAKGELDQARSWILQAETIYFRSRLIDSTDVQYYRNLSDIHSQIGDIYAAGGNLDSARIQYTISVNLYRKLVSVEPHNLKFQYSLGALLANSGRLARSTGKPDFATRELLEAESIAVSLLESDYSDIYYRQLQITTMGEGALLDLALGDTTRAKKRLLRVISLSEGLSPEAGEYSRNIALINVELADIYEAEEDFRSSLEARWSVVLAIEQVMDQNSGVADARHDLGHNLHKIGDLYASIRQYDSAQFVYLQAAEIRVSLSKDMDTSRHFVQDVAVTYESIGDISRKLSNTDDAIHAYGRAQEFVLMLTTLDSLNSEYQRFIAVLFRKKARAYLEAGMQQEAKQVLDSALLINRELISQEPDNVSFQDDLMKTMRLVQKLPSEYSP